MWWQILLMVLSVLFVVFSVYRTIIKLYKEESCHFLWEAIFITAGISYLIWFCN